VQHAERAIAILLRADDGAKTEDVRKLLEVELLVP
jgi:hypothetical protein